MADSGRSRGQGRGRGDGGRGRGDGGRGRGDGGRGRGDGGRGRGDGGRGRGDFRGGRGRGGDDRGSFRGGGRGGFRGGGGGFQDTGPPIYKPSHGGIPAPSQEITNLENEWIRKSSGKTKIADLSESLQRLGITSSGASDAQVLAALPHRPAFGTQGTPVVLWANYFSMTIKSQTLYKYVLTVKRAGSSDKDTGGGSDVVGKLLRTIIEEALHQVVEQNPGNRIVSEYKAKVVSQGLLSLPNGTGPVTVRHSKAGSSRFEDYTVIFGAPEPVEIGKLLQWLTSMNDRLDEIQPTFPKFEATIDSVGIVMNHHARKSDGIVSLGTSSARFFPSDINPTIERSQISAMKDIVRGYFSSARPATGRLLLNVNVTHGIFQRSGNAQNLIKALMEECRARDFRSPVLRRAATRLSKVKFEHAIFDARGNQIGTGERAILELSKTSAKDTTFKLQAPKDAPAETWADGSRIQYDQMISVAEYYRKKFSKIVDNSIPLIVSGSSKRKLYFPSEFCRILPNHSSTGKLSAAESAAMINFACRSPARNAESIAQVGAQILGISGTINQICQSFGITVNPELVTVQGRILPSPILSYMSQDNVVRKVTASDGSWNLRDLKVVKGGTVASWGCIVLIDPNEPQGRLRPAEVVETMSAFTKFLRSNMGINIPLLSNAQVQVQPWRYEEGDEYNSIKTGFKHIQANRFKMVFVILPDSKDATVYSAVKRVADVDFGVHTVCMVRKNLFKNGPGNNPQYYANVGLKVNLKAGGINHKLAQDIPLIKGGKTMVVGWDVLHPTNLGVDRDSGLPSVVGLVASIDEHLAQWPAASWAQKGGQEMADSRLEDRFKSRLVLWQKYNQGRLPENILVFRDGVSEGQFATVEQEELPLVRKACAGIYPGGKIPKITIVVSVKRHQTRFYPTDEKNMSRSMNNKSGTVVDRGVTVARYWDFFLQSHDALKGTARPARYTVLHNEIFPTAKGANAADELEKLTHSLSYLFGRATKAVSICPPAYYADIVCTRHRAHLTEVFDSVIMGGSVVSGESSGLSTISESQILTRVDALNVHQNLADSMYWI